MTETKAKNHPEEPSNADDGGNIGSYEVRLLDHGLRPEQASELLDRAWNVTKEESQRNLDRVREALDELRDEAIMRDDLARHAFHQVGACEGPSISMHVVRGCDQLLLCGEIKVRSERSPFSATHDLLKLWPSSRGSDSDAVVTRRVTKS